MGSSTPVVVVSANLGSVIALQHFAHISPWAKPPVTAAGQADGTDPTTRVPALDCQPLRQHPSYFFPHAPLSPPKIARVRSISHLVGQTQSTPTHRQLGRLDAQEVLRPIKGSLASAGPELFGDALELKSLFTLGCPLPWMVNPKKASLPCVPVNANGLGNVTFITPSYITHACSSASTVDGVVFTHFADSFSMPITLLGGWTNVFYSMDACCGPLKTLTPALSKAIHCDWEIEGGSTVLEIEADHDLCKMCLCRPNFVPVCRYI